MSGLDLCSTCWILLLGFTPAIIAQEGFTSGSTYTFGDFGTAFGDSSQFGNNFFSRPFSFYPSTPAYREPLQASPHVGYGPNYYSALDGTFLDYRDNQQQTLKCVRSKYRTIDGTCNNLKNPRWGAANTPYGRLIAPKYADHVSQPPVSVTGKQLPNSRQLSLAFFPDVDIHDPLWTLSAMQWGQIITHDMSFAAGARQGPSHATKCCRPDGAAVIPEMMRDPTCYPIQIPAEDPLSKKFGQRCMNFVRTMNNAGQTRKAAEQIVAVTHWMDASLVYGPSNDLAQTLRTFKDGKMRVEVKEGRYWPPSNPNKTDCEGQHEKYTCYLTGDGRANQNPQLTIFHIILLREHNRLANGLHKVNPHWDDETLYQEARRILIAEFQHISYYEWLPIFLGKETLLRHGIIYDAHNAYVNDYNDKINPSVLNSHATAAFRYFHSNIQGHLQLITESRYASNVIRLSDYFNKPGFLEEANNLDDLTRGMATQPQQKTDRFHTSEITDFLFRDKKPFGRDLKAIDIHRSRDHGLASYNSYRSFCGLAKANTFEHFTDVLDAKTVEDLKKLYAHVEDVDLGVAGPLERHVPGTLAGPTFLCIMAEQFYRTRVADRFFYENGKNEGAFSPAQLTEIRKSSIARLMCDNADHVQSMQPKGFEKLSEGNPLVACSDDASIPVINLNAWADHPVKKYQTFI